MFLFKKLKKYKESQGLILFEKVEDAINAEKILRNNNYNVKLVAPPPELRKGCDISIEFNIYEIVGIEETLKVNSINYTDIKPIKGNRELLKFVKIVDFNDAVMVKAGNMKITVHKIYGTILNISGGGCPDIPYLNLQLVGKNIKEVKRPREIGLTLCALMLDRAYEECLKIVNDEIKLC